jgi:arsenite-transporting ATPase
VTKIIHPNSLKDVVDKQRVIVVLGAGGVGKTTTAVAIAMSAAEQGRRVALLSIDPAKRLAAALGIPLGHELRAVQLAPHVKGSLYATMLDQKAVFDSMVKKHAPSPRIADRILRDPLYVSASTSLSGPLEYMALARLQELADDPNYDLIVLDTPPDAHALDFLGRPYVLSNFLDKTVMNRILKPVVAASKMGLGGILSVGERLLGGISKVTGFKTLAAFAEFVLIMREVLEGFQQSGERVLELLKRPSSSFIMVAVPTEAAKRSAVFLMERMRSMNYELAGLVLNRCLPARLAESGDQASYFAARTRGEAKVKAELQDALREWPTTFTKPVDEIDQDLQTLDGIQTLAKALGLAPQSL